MPVHLEPSRVFYANKTFKRTKLVLEFMRVDFVSCVRFQLRADCVVDAHFYLQWLFREMTRFWPLRWAVMRIDCSSFWAKVPTRNSGARCVSHVYLLRNVCSNNDHVYRFNFSEEPLYLYRCRILLVIIYLWFLTSIIAIIICILQTCVHVWILSRYRLRCKCSDCSRDPQRSYSPLDRVALSACACLWRPAPIRTPRILCANLSAVFEQCKFGFYHWLVQQIVLNIWFSLIFELSNQMK